jgi:hypothetical protein
VLLEKNEKKLSRSFNFTFRYIYDVLSLNSSRFGDFVDHIYPIELEIGSVASLLAAILYQGKSKRNHKLWNIVSTEIYILHMQVLLECCYIWKSSEWENWNYLFCRKVTFFSTRKLLNQGFRLVMLKSSFRTFYDCHHDFVDRYGICVTNDQGCVPLVVNTSRSWEQELISFRSTCVHPLFSVGFVLLDLLFYGYVYYKTFNSQFRRSFVTHIP